MTQIETSYLIKELDKNFAPCYENTYFHPRPWELPVFGKKREGAGQKAGLLTRFEVFLVERPNEFCLIFRMKHATVDGRARRRLRTFWENQGFWQPRPREATIA
ncbi:MAG: hypothetical protein GTN81_02050 [Proteobacteria bacterium]|nr:hypothetical protein [Pseudomonadota bacterium]